MKYIRVALLALILIMAIGIAAPAYAETEPPDSDPTIEKFNVYRNLLETGDMLVLVYANIPYATPPETLVTITFIWSLVDTDGTTELGSTVGYAYNDGGFGYNVYSMYFSAAEVIAKGMTVWGTSYIVRLSGNPVYFTTPPVYNYYLSASDYTALSDTSDVQAELAARILQIATDLDSKWGLATIYSLVTELEAGAALSLYGQAFFRGAIYGVQSFAPAIFPVQIRNLTITDRTWDTEFSENLTGQWGGTWVDTAQAAGKALFGVDYDLLSMIILLMLCGGLVAANIMLTNDAWNAFIDVAFLAVIGARLAMYDLALLLLLAAGCWLYISAKVWFGIIK